MINLKSLKQVMMSS